MEFSEPERAALLKGMSLGPQEAAALELRLEAEPADRGARAQLIGYYSRFAEDAEGAAAALQQHVVWFIEHPPSEPIVRTPPVTLEELEAKLMAEEDELARFHIIVRILQGALDRRDGVRLHRYSMQALELAPRFPDSWNHGNGLHLGHSALGMLALDSGDLEAAARHLVASAETPGSPQLNSFGPSLELAQQLMDRGQLAAVQQFLERCQSFWELGRGKLHFWLGELTAGRTPKLSRPN